MTVKNYWKVAKSLCDVWILLDLRAKGIMTPFAKLTMDKYMLCSKKHSFWSSVTWKKERQPTTTLAV